MQRVRVVLSGAKSIPALTPLASPQSRRFRTALTADSDERSFLLDASLFLSLGATLDPSSASSGPSGLPPLSFTWLDPDGDGPDDEFEFVLPADGTVSEEQARDFEKLCWRCMWERKENCEWPTDANEAKRADAALADEFKVECVHHVRNDMVTVN